MWSVVMTSTVFILMIISILIRNSVPGGGFQDAASWKAEGRGLALKEWRRENNNDLIRRLVKGCAAV